MIDLLHRRLEIIHRMSWWRFAVVAVSAQILSLYAPHGVGFAIDFAEVVLLYAAPR